MSKLGSYEDITASGFNIKDILDSFNQTNKDNAKSPKKAFKKEQSSASPKKLGERTSEKKKEEGLTPTLVK